MPSSDFLVDLTGELAHDGNRGAFGGFTQGTGRSVTGASANPQTVFFAAASRIRLSMAPSADLWSGVLSVDPTLNRNTYTNIARIEGNLGFAMLTSVSAYKKLDVADSRNLEGSSMSILDQISTENSKQFTQEIRLN